MYMLKESFGDVDVDDEPDVVEILGTYESLDEACEAAESEFDAIMERLGDPDCDEVRFGDIVRSCGDCYVTYGYRDCEIGYVLEEHYYRVYVIER